MQARTLSRTGLSGINKLQERAAQALGLWRAAMPSMIAVHCLADCWCHTAELTHRLCNSRPEELSTVIWQWLSMSSSCQLRLVWWWWASVHSENTRPAMQCQRYSVHLHQPDQCHASMQVTSGNHETAAASHAMALLSFVSSCHAWSRSPHRRSDS